MWFPGLCSFSLSGLHRPPGPSFCPQPPWSNRRRPRGNDRVERGDGGGGAGGRGSGAARPGGAVTPSPTAGPEAGAPGVGRPARGLGRVCAPGKGPAGSWSLASPRPAGPGAWKAGGHRRAPLAGLLVRTDFSLVASSRSLRDVKLGNFWVSCKNVDFLVKCFS